MAGNQRQLMTKSEISDLLGVSISDLCRWSQSFAGWLDVCPERVDRTHDEDDVFIFTLINEFDRQVKDDIPFNQRIRSIDRGLWSSPRAVSIRQQREMEETRPEVTRWQLVSSAGVCLKYEYEWLKPLRSQVESIADFGCWAIEAGTCSEPYALLWTLEASRVVVIDKNPEHIRIAQEWLKNARERYAYFADYDLEFINGDMADEIDALDESAFDLSHCEDVLYNMYPDLGKLQASINTMAKAVKPNGWIIAIEPKMGVEFEETPCEIFDGEVSLPVPMNKPVDVSHHFEAAGLIRVSLDSAPEWSYCFMKPNG